MVGRLLAVTPLQAMTRVGDLARIKAGGTTAKLCVHLDVAQFVLTRRRNTRSRQRRVCDELTFT